MMQQETEEPKKLRLREFKNNEYIMGYVDKLNQLLPRKKPQIIDIESIPIDKKTITDSVYYSVLENQGIWKLPEDKEPLYGVRYIEQPRTMKGNSAHGVFFVEAQRGGAKVEIAVKPFVTREEKGKDQASSASKNSLIEFINTVLVEQKGIKTFTPIICIIDGETGFNLSLVKKGVRSLDQQNWKNYILDANKESRTETSGKLKNVARCLADMHKKGIIHGDAQIKNFATTPDSTIFPFDWEASKVYQNITEDEYLSGAEKDMMKVLVSSYRLPDTGNYKNSGIGIFNVSSPEKNVWENFNNIVFTPYLDELIYNNKNSPTFRFDITEAAEKLEETLKKRAESPETYAKK